MQRALGAIVTGSTGGLGTAIAQALGRAGTHVMLDGFGDQDSIEALRHGLAAETGVQVGDSAADMLRPEAIARTVAQTDSSAAFQKNAGAEPLRAMGPAAPASDDLRSFGTERHVPSVFWFA